MKKRQLIISSTFTIFACIASTTFATANQSQTSNPKLPCRIEVSVAHISTDFFEKTGRRAVKVDAFSKCNVPQSKITLTVEIRKVGAFGSHLVWTTTVKSSGTTFPGNQVNNYGTYRICRNKTPTRYYGVAFSKAFIAGKWQYARHVLSREITSIQCGT